MVENDQLHDFIKKQQKTTPIANVTKSVNPSEEAHKALGTLDLSFIAVWPIKITTASQVGIVLDLLEAVGR